MKSTKDIKAFYKGAAIDTNPAQDEAVLADALQAGGLTTKKRAARTEPSVWRAIMKSRTTQLATAAIIVIALLISIQQLGGSLDGASVAWGDVRDAFLDRPWVHLKYDNGTEQWYNLKTGDYFFKDWDGRCVAINYAANIRHNYEPALSDHITEVKSAVYEDGVVPPWQPKTAWEIIVGRWEQMAERGETGNWEVETAIDEKDGGRRVRFDGYFNDAAGRRLLIRRIWADPETRLPVKVWKRLQLADRKDQQREAVAGTFDFPDKGPQSIYDLGVARDLPVVRPYDKTPAVSVQAAIDAAKEALERFAPRYRVVVWSNERAGTVEVVWRDGPRIHQDHYFSVEPDSTPGGVSDHYLPLPATVHQVLDWARTQTPISTSMFDGQKIYTRSYRHPVLSDSRDEVRVTRSNDSFLMSMWSRPMEVQWPWERRNPASFELIDDAPEEFQTYIGLRTEQGGSRSEYYLDPERDHICVRTIRWKQRSGQWERQREYTYSDFKRLPTGQWYGGKRTVVSYRDPDRGTSRGGETKNIDVELLEEDDYPPGAFDGEQLMEGATLETY